MHHLTNVKASAGTDGKADVTWFGQEVPMSGNWFIYIAIAEVALFMGGLGFVSIADAFRKG
ncbi:hypothetical protein ACFB49_07030 [Sphingomonas sp. DBB INV C78]